MKCRTAMPSVSTTRYIRSQTTAVPKPMTASPMLTSRVVAAGWP